MLPRIFATQILVKRNCPPSHQTKCSILHQNVTMAIVKCPPTFSKALHSSSKALQSCQTTNFHFQNTILICQVLGFCGYAEFSSHNRP